MERRVGQPAMYTSYISLSAAARLGTWYSVVAVPYYAMKPTRAIFSAGEPPNFVDALRALVVGNSAKINEAWATKKGSPHGPPFFDKLNIIYTIG